MALRSGAAALARRVMAPKAALPLRGGGGGPVALANRPSRPLAEEDELLWDDGSANPEYCIDQFNQITSGQALGMWAATMGTFGLVAAAAWLNDKPSKQPFVTKQFPYEELRAELGGFTPRGEAAE